MGQFWDIFLFGSPLVNFRKVLDDKDRYLEEEDKKLSRQIKQIERREEDCHQDTQ
ncbi:MAG: hypothetical protein V7K97_11975 [Nostoc sp.]|uniref:hypothetical protein n=1 Tax=Nostoc sp. TaxID=1180 RepID=UPI002FF75C77